MGNVLRRRTAVGKRYGKRYASNVGPCNVGLRPSRNVLPWIVRSARNMIGFKQIEFFDHTLQNAVDVDDSRSGRGKVNPAHSKNHLRTLSECVEDCGMPRPERFPTEIPISENIGERSLGMEPSRKSCRVARVPGATRRNLQHIR